MTVIKSIIWLAKIIKKFLSSKNIYKQSILDYEPKCKYNLAFIKTVLIHINSDELQNAYEKLYNSSNKYIPVVKH